MQQQLHTTDALTQPVQRRGWQDDFVSIVSRLLVYERQRERPIGCLEGPMVVPRIAEHVAG
jgi:hypothetical protein